MAQKFKSKSKEQLVNSLRCVNAKLNSDNAILKSELNRQIKRNAELQHCIHAISKISESIHL